MSPGKGSSMTLLTILVYGSDVIHGLSGHPLLLVVLYDGFRWDYLERFYTPNFHSLAKDGVRAMRVMNAFPTTTMANHYTILTGWRVENHGVVSNNFDDPDHGRYRMENWDHQVESRWFDTGPEPIWVTNQRASNDRYSGSVLWPDSLAKVKGIGTTYKTGPPLFDKNVKNKTRVDTIIKWFLDPVKPINLGLLYFEEPDFIGHVFGPDSEQMKETVTGMDDVTGYLIAQLKSHDLFDRMNIILTSDHGMTATSANRVVDISEFVSADLYDGYVISSTGLLSPWPGYEKEVYDGLRKLEKKYPQIKVYFRNDPFLKIIHYSDNNRIAPVVITVNDGWLLINENSDKSRLNLGEHGYLPSVTNMGPFFVAHGPAFKKGYVTESLDTIDMYELMCHVLRLSPRPNDGSLGDIKHILLEDSAIVYILRSFFYASISALVMIAAWMIVHSRQQGNR